MKHKPCGFHEAPALRALVGASPKNVSSPLRSSEAGRRGRRPLPRLSPFSAKPKRRPHFGGEGYSRGAKTDPFSLRARQAGASRKPQGFCFMFAQDGSPRASTPTMRLRRASFFSLHHWGRGTAPAVEGVRLLLSAKQKCHIAVKSRPKKSTSFVFFGFSLRYDPPL